MTPVAVAIVSFNTRTYLDACLSTVRTAGGSEAVVVDNGSTDGSIELVRTAYPWVRLEVASVNRGYGAAANRAIALCTAPYVLLLNSDTALEAGALTKLAAYLDAHPRAAVVGPRVVNPDGTLQPSCFSFPTPWLAFLSETDVAYPLRFIPGLRQRYLRTWSHNRARVVPWVRGAALVIRRDAFERVGGFDERFHMYFEETDLCYRCGTAGWEVHFAPVTTVVHHGGVSTRQHRAAMLARYYESMFRFYRHHYSAARLARLELVLRGVALGRLVRDTLRLWVTLTGTTRQRLSEDVALWRDLLRGKAVRSVELERP